VAGETTWPGPALLVPITVEVLILTGPSYNAQWWWGVPNYRFLGIFAPPAPPPFGINPPNFPGATGPLYGAVVSWSLPDALTHGIETTPGTIEYPPVPNRWLVTRKCPNPTKPAEWAYSTWVVASDYFTTTGTNNGTGFVNPAGTLAANDIAGVLGNSWPAASWPGEAAVSAFDLVPPLTAIGQGDPSFAAFVPNVINVFAFPDDLSALAPGFVSYSVFGYYSNPANDPLFGAAQYGSAGWQTADQWNALMQQLEWSAGDAADLTRAQQASAAWAQAHGMTVDPNDPHQQLPARTLCHGQTFAVAWPGPTAVAASGMPPINAGDPRYIEPQVALAHSPTDALATMLAASEAGMTPVQIAAMVDILEAFQYGSLSLIGSQPELDIQLQNGWFNSVGGPTRWSVVAPGGSGNTPGTQADLTPAQAQLLMQLNVAQQALDASRAEIASQQAELFGLWWKSNRAPHDGQPIPAATITAAMTATQTAITNLLATFTTLEQERNTAQTSLTAILGTLELRKGAGQPFLAPNEPVVMISGVRRSFLHGEDDRFTAGNALFCRFTGQTVASLSIPNESTITAGSFGLPVSPSADFPPEVNDLWVEAFFLDVTNAPVIAQAAGSTNPWLLLATIEQEQTLIWNPDLSAGLDAQTIAELSGLNTLFNLGAIPSKAGVQLWSPPWVPLYLQWQISFTPAAGTQQEVLAPWSLAPPADSEGFSALDDFTYQYTGSLPSTGAVQFSGMSLLTPQATDVLAARIEQAIAEWGTSPGFQADLTALQDALDYIRNADLLAQALSGFNLALLQRAPETFRIPDDGSLDAWLFPPGGPQFAPSSIPSPDAPDVQYNPIRAGHFQVINLQVVDAFGQAFDVLSAMLMTPANFQALNGPDLVTPGNNPALTELKPRIIQFSRFLLAFLDATTDANVVGIVPGADPICGWLIPDHLDEGILVYDATGTFLGELLAGASGVVLNLPPDSVASSASDATSLTAGNLHLRGLVNGLLGQPNTALQALMDVMQQSLWTLDPNGGWSDQELPALIGRPLAVVRASAQLQLLGLPAWSQTWANTGSNETAGFDQVQFPVQFGSTELDDDGVVGYFVNDDYTQIQSMYPPSPASAYVGSAGVPLAAGASSPALVTFVLHPQYAIHAISGIYPPLSFTLPAAFATAPLSAMEIVFRTGPILGRRAPVGMPLPNLREGAWSWLQYADTTEPAFSTAVAASDPTASLPQQPTLIREGWLKLLLAGPPTQFTYDLSPLPLVCSTPASASTVTLTITVYNGSGADVSSPQLQIALTLPVGTGAGDLTADPSTVAASASASSGWTFVASTTTQGLFTATPPAASPELVKGATLTLRLAGVRVNQTAGTSSISIVESTGTTREAQLAVAKITASTPVRAQILTFSSSPAQVAPGQATTLSWDTVNGTSGVIHPGAVSASLPSGSLSVSPKQATLYTFSLYGPEAVSTVSTYIGIAPAARTP
jgi:hypothetical protein